MPSRKRTIYYDRELSWLAFNGRVLQEAEDPSVPLFERLKFLAIYSQNLDEFFRVRVASLRSLLRLKKKSVNKLGVDPASLLHEIHDTVTRQQERFGEIFRREILPELEQHNIFLIQEDDLTPDQGAFLEGYFADKVQAHLSPTVLTAGEIPFLTNQQIYLVAELWRAGESLSVEEPRFGLVEVPSPPVERFVVIPSRDQKHNVIFLDDVVRYNLPTIFPDYRIGDAFAVKISRDAELYIEDEFSGSLVDQIRRSLKKRETGMPCRFLYDLHASYSAVSFMKATFGLQEEDLVLGGRYHNLRDLMDFPRFGLEDLAYEELPPLEHPALEGVSSLFPVIAEKDRIVHYPYQKFDYAIQFLEEAAADPDVEEIWITLYRTARDSAVVNALLKAAEAGKRVTAFVEVKARFDEASNLRWADQMEAAGVRILYSFPKLKVHAKLALVTRVEDGARRRYAYLSTGNFNEKTARIYTDSAVFTADHRLTEEVLTVFRFLDGQEKQPSFEHLLVSPFYLRKALNRLIADEMEAVERDETGSVRLKMNSLEDPKIIDRLYDAARAGVSIEMVVRGICCLVPGVEGLSENVVIRSIVDRFLEHVRLLEFHSGGEKKMYLASADWMTRNLDRRVEVAFPIYDTAIRRELKEMLDLQFMDNVKARVIDAEQRNEYVMSDGDEPLCVQMDTYEFLKRKLTAAREHVVDAS